MEENTLTSKLDKQVERVDTLEKLAAETLNTILNTHNMVFRIEREMERESKRKEEWKERIQTYLFVLFVLIITILTTVGIFSLAGMVN